MLRQLRHLVKAIRQRGVLFLVSYFRESFLFDLRHGTKTSARVPKDEQTIEGDGVEQNNGLLYVASFTSVTVKSVGLARQLLGPELFRKSQFVDLGCGKGKALLVNALNYGELQEHVSIGIEYDPTLAEMAKANIIKCGLTPDSISIITDSAINVRKYVSAETLIVYLFNSFQDETLRTVLGELSHVPHVLIYVDPAQRDMLQDFDYELRHDVVGPYGTNTWLVASHQI